MLRELDQRECDGLTVTLEWDSDTNQVQVRCHDERTPSRPPLCYHVEPGDARLVFRYAFALQPIEERGSPDPAPEAEPNQTAERRHRRWFRPGRNPQRGRVTDASHVPWPWWLI
jgi:hypothetical protein